MYITKLIHGWTGVGDLVSPSIGCGEQGNAMFLEMIAYGPIGWGDLEHVFSFWLPSCVIDHSSHYCFSTHDFKLHTSYPHTIII
jgi:hypothetical protein